MSEHHIADVVRVEKLSNAAPWSEASLRGELTNPQARYFVALEGNSVVGFGGLWLIVDEAHVTNVAVLPELRGKGIGRKLMLRLLQSARDEGMQCSTLEVRISNNPAIALYESLGYVKCGIRKNYYPNDREDAVVMWLYNLQGQPK